MHTKNEILSATIKDAVQMIRANLAENKWWAVRGLQAIYSRQTCDEQSAETTSHDNGVGFTGCDANIMSSFAKQIARWEASADRRYDFPLSPQQLAIVQRKMPKYARQLLNIARASAAATSTEPATAAA